MRKHPFGKEKGIVDLPVGVVVGNPPFESKLRTEGAKRSYERYIMTEGSLADKQVAYLFLHESMQLVAPGGVLSMLQQYNLIYKLNSESYHRVFFTRWDVREVLDFVSIRGLFNKGGADTKIVVIVAQANEAPPDRKVLHAVFRRGARAQAEQGFDIDFYDLNWLPRENLLKDLGPDIWRSNLLGCARARSFVKRLRGMRTLRDLAKARGWAIGEGFIDGAQRISRSADHLTGQPLLPSLALTEAGIDREKISSVPDRAIEGPRTAALFTPPMLLIREHEDLPHATWTEHYLAFRDQIFGIGNADETELARIDQWMSEESIPLKAYIAGISRKLFTQRATSLGGADVGSIPILAAIHCSSRQRRRLGRHACSRLLILADESGPDVASGRFITGLQRPRAWLDALSDFIADQLPLWARPLRSPGGGGREPPDIAALRALEQHDPTCNHRATAAFQAVPELDAEVPGLWSPGGQRRRLDASFLSKKRVLDPGWQPVACAPDRLSGPVAQLDRAAAF